jgi:sugar/nucleoside kinase (ribokinase family)
MTSDLMKSSGVTVLVIGGCGIDYTILGDALPSAGHSITGEMFLRDTGGKGLNQAIAAARLGGSRSHRARLMFVLDAAPSTRVPEELVRLADVVTVNGEEASALSGVDVQDRDSAHIAARAICTLGARHVCVGIAEGRVVVSSAEERWLKSHHVAVLDTTGAGDACAAGIAGCEGVAPMACRR